MPICKGRDPVDELAVAILLKNQIAARSWSNELITEGQNIF